MINTINLLIVGLICLAVLVYSRFNEAANFCTGSHLSDEDRHREVNLPDSHRTYLIERGNFLWEYTAIIVSLVILFLTVLISTCLYNLKKMGF